MKMLTTDQTDWIVAAAVPLVTLALALALWGLS